MGSSNSWPWAPCMQFCKYTCLFSGIVLFTLKYRLISPPAQAHINQMSGRLYTRFLQFLGYLWSRDARHLHEEVLKFYCQRSLGLLGRFIDKKILARLCLLWRHARQRGRILKSDGSQEGDKMRNKITY